MKAITRYEYGGSNQLNLETVDDPEPAKNQVVLRVLACGLNLSDWEGLTGQPLYARIGGLIRPRQPILGSDIVGEVVAVGSDVKGWDLGQRVWAEVVSYGMGGLAEMAVVSANRLSPLPEHLDPVISAALPQSGAIALAAVKDILKDQRVLVNGAGGGSGTLILQLASQMGAHVTGVDTSEKADLMMQLGAEQTIDYREVDFAQATETWDHILDLVASRSAWKVRRALTENGRYLMFGGHIGAMLSTLVTPQCSIGTAEGTPDILERLGQMARDGGLSPKIAEVVSLADAPSALSKLGAGHVSGKIVVVPSQ